MRAEEVLSIGYDTIYVYVWRAKRAGRLAEELEKIGRLPLIVVDEVGFHPLRPRGGGALLRPRQLPLRAQLDHRELEQDLLGLDGRASATR